MRTERCACGGNITVVDRRHIAKAVREHNDTHSHRLYRALRDARERARTSGNLDCAMTPRVSLIAR